MADDCKYALVLQARIDAVTATSVTFSSRSSKDELESFTVQLTEILQGPPTHAPLPVALTPGAIGNLYLSEDGWKQKAASGATLYKAGDKNVVLFKWPRCIPFRILDLLEVTPTKIWLEGTDTATKQPIKIDLLGADAAPAQSVNWRAAAPITVELSQAGSAANGGAKNVVVWPKKLEVTAASVRKPQVSATVDVLDVKFADFNQQFAWSQPKDPIALMLSTSGFNEFSVSPGPIVHLASGFPVAYPEDVARECELLTTADPDVREICQRARARAAALQVP